MGVLPNPSPNAEVYAGFASSFRVFSHSICRALHGCESRSAKEPNGFGKVVLVKWTLARKVVLAREELKKAQEDAGVQLLVPEWLESFGNARETKKKISEIIDFLDRSDENRSSDTTRRQGISAPTSLVSELPGVPLDERPSKRRRQMMENDADPVLKAQIYAVRTARKKLLRNLTHGRTGARMKLFSNLLFVLERIWSYEDPVKASEEGFAVLFPPGYDDDDIVPAVGPAMPSGSPWKIDLALKNGQGTEEYVRQANLQKFVEMQRAFPGLAVKLNYRISVRRSPSDDPGGLPEFNDPDLFVSTSDDISLHSVAASCLLGASRATDFDEVLGTSELSLRAIHVMAIGLRGLLKKALHMNGSGPELTDTEKYSLGDVSARLVGRGDF